MRPPAAVSAFRGENGTMARMSDKERGYAHRVDILADVGLVWRALTDQDQLARWCSPGRRHRAAPGRAVPRERRPRHASSRRTSTCSSRPRRLRLIYLPSATLPRVRPACMIDDFIIEPAGAARSCACSARVCRRRRVGYAVPAAAHQLAAGPESPEGASSKNSAKRSASMIGFLLRALIAALRPVARDAAGSPGVSHRRLRRR